VGLSVRGKGLYTDLETIVNIGRGRSLRFQVKGLGSRV